MLKAREYVGQLAKPETSASAAVELAKLIPARSFAAYRYTAHDFAAAARRSRHHQTSWKRFHRNASLRGQLAWTARPSPRP